MSRMTFTAPAGGSFKDAAKMDWNEVDIDELVERLTPGEIQKLLEEFDPDDPHTPASERTKYHCDKMPTGKIHFRRKKGLLANKLDELQHYVNEISVPN